MYLWHTEVPRLGVKSEMQLLAYAMATTDLCCICDLCCSFQELQILNQLSETSILMNTSWVLNLLSHSGDSCLNILDNKEHYGHLGLFIFLYVSFNSLNTCWGPVCHSSDGNPSTYLEGSPWPGPYTSILRSVTTCSSFLGLWPPQITYSSLLTSLVSFLTSLVFSYPLRFLLQRKKGWDICLASLYPSEFSLFLEYS